MSFQQNRHTLYIQGRVDETDIDVIKWMVNVYASNQSEAFGEP